MWNDSNTQNDEQNIMFKSQCSHMWLQKSILSHVTTLTFVVTCDYIDFFLANVTVNHNVHNFTIIVHGYLFHSCLINVVNYNGHWQCHPITLVQILAVKFLEQLFLFGRFDYWTGTDWPLQEMIPHQTCLLLVVCQFLFLDMTSPSSGETMGFEDNCQSRTSEFVFSLLLLFLLHEHLLESWVKPGGDTFFCIK